MAQDEDPAAGKGSDSVGHVAFVAATGAGIDSAKLSRNEPREAKKVDAKNESEKSATIAIAVKEEVEREQNDASRNNLELYKPIERAPQVPGHLDNLPQKSLDRLTSLHRPDKGLQQEYQSSNRDSGIQISDSPTVPSSEPVHRPQHDSGYPATETSPLVSSYEQEDHEEQDPSDPYINPRIGSVGLYRDYDERPDSIASDNRQSIIGSDDQERSSDRRGARRRRKRRDSNVTYDSDDSNDSGYDRQRRRRQTQQTEELREPSPVSSTTKNRSSLLFNSSPSDRPDDMDRHLPMIDHVNNEQQPLNRQYSQTTGLPQADSHDPELHVDAQDPQDVPHSIFGGPMPGNEVMSRSRSPPSDDARGRQQFGMPPKDSLEHSPLAGKGKRDVSGTGSRDSGVKARPTSHDLSPLMTGAAAGATIVGTEDLVRHLHRPSNKGDDESSMDMEKASGRDHDRRSSNQSNASASYRDHEWRRQAIGSPDSIHAIIRTPDQVRSSSRQSFQSSGTPPLRRVDRSVSGDLRGASMKIDAKRRAKMAEAEPATSIPSSSTYDPLTDKGKSRGDMADVYVSSQRSPCRKAGFVDASQEGDGWRGQSPMSPTRPPSMRKRQSMHFADLEQRFEQLAADHRSLQSAKLVVDRRLEEQAKDHGQQRQTYEDAVQEHKSYLAEKDSELRRLHDLLDGFKRQVSELTAANEELQTSRGLDPDRVGDQSFQILASQNENSRRELEDLREQHAKLADDHEDILEREIEAVRQENDSELRQLQEELDNAKAEVRALQQQILASRSSDEYVEHDEDYFETKCTALCQHVQQWILRFSKFSDTHACRMVGELSDDTLADFFDDAILDGTEVDEYLQDRIKRRDIFMSVVMSRIVDFIFRRYLFGLDREQRKKTQRSPRHPH